MAHDLGHILLHHWSENLDLTSKEEFKSRENQANSFASAFLLPKESFLQEIQAYLTDLNYYLHKKTVALFHAGHDLQGPPTEGNH